MDKNITAVIRRVAHNLRESWKLNKINDRRASHSAQVKLFKLAREYDQLWFDHKDLIIDHYDQILDLAHKR